jgi:hypothetical protein
MVYAWTSRALRPDSEILVIVGRGAGRLGGECEPSAPWFVIALNLSRNRSNSLRRRDLEHARATSSLGFGAHTPLPMQKVVGSNFISPHSELSMLAITDAAAEAIKGVVSRRARGEGAGH